MDRNLITPQTAFQQGMQNLKDHGNQLRRRVRYPGAVHQTSGVQYNVDFTSSATSFELARVQVDPGRWSVIARATVNILQTVADPNVSGKEYMELNLVALDPDEVQTHVLDSVMGQLPFSPLAGHASGQMFFPLTAFGSERFDVVTTIVLNGKVDNVATEDAVSFRHVKILALPF